jgi:hypothetical protein
MKRIGVVTTSANDLDTCKRRLADSEVPIVDARLEQEDYLSIYIEDQHLDAAILALRKGGFDAAVM